MGTRSIFKVQPKLSFNIYALLLFFASKQTADKSRPVFVIKQVIVVVFLIYALLTLNFDGFVGVLGSAPTLALIMIGNLVERYRNTDRNG